MNQIIPPQRHYIGNRIVHQLLQYDLPSSQPKVFHRIKIYGSFEALILSNLLTIANYIMQPLRLVMQPPKNNC